MKIGIAQLNPTVGDIATNMQLAIVTAKTAADTGCDLVLFPELFLTGYPPEDLLLKPAFVSDNLAALNTLAKQIKRTAALIGFVDRRGGQCFNAAAWIEGGRVRDVYHKRQLPNYGVFDELRYFKPGHRPLVRTLKGMRVGVTICEDVWILGDHLSDLKKAKADVVVNISASPFHVGKLAERKKAFVKTVRAMSAPLIYCNMVGGQDELVFDGASFAMSTQGRTAAQFGAFKQQLYTLDVERKNKKIVLTTDTAAEKPLSGVEEIHEALLLGLRDYVRKNGFSKVAIGLSGGIDSAVVAALAAEALGPSNVIGVTMPTKYNLAETKSDAALVAKNLGIQFHEIPIQSIFGEFLKSLEPMFRASAPNIAEENLQARVRGTLMMALSNKFGWLVLTTGNKSETSTGYCTLYGDMAGGFAVIKDILKTTVYAVAELINKKAGRELIPETTIKRPPTAELRENQKDEDSLGAYADLDPIIVDYVEKNIPAAEQIKKRKDKEAYIRRILRLIDLSEYKRRQSPPGVKITPRSFGRDHRMPITNRYKSA